MINAFRHLKGASHMNSRTDIKNARQSTQPAIDQRSEYNIFLRHKAIATGLSGYMVRQSGFQLIEFRGG